MDLETENRVAALLLEEARRLRVQADKEGVHVYLCQPNVRGRPNSRFLTATVLGVQQANRAAEVSELWRAREKELELEAKLKRRANGKGIIRGEKHLGNLQHSSSSSRHVQVNRNSAITCSSSKDGHEDGCSSEDSGLRDEEVEEFLHSRAKRGRGAIGSRMDEAGPYLSSTSSDHEEQLLLNPDVRMKEEWEHRVLGPEKPSLLRTKDPLNDDCDSRVRVECAFTLKKHHTEDKEKSKKEKYGISKRKEKKSKHHHKRRRRDDL